MEYYDKNVKGPHLSYYEALVKKPVEAFARKWHADWRGRLMEGLRNDDSMFNGDFGQAYVTTIEPGRVKAWHYHRKQTDRMLLLRGIVRFGCIGNDEVLLDLVVRDIDPKLIVIPQDIYHGFMNLGEEEAYILNIPTEAYDHKEPDEVRLPYEHFSNDLFQWGSVDYNG